MKKIILGQMLIDGTGKAPLPRPAIVVEDGRIRSEFARARRRRRDDGEKLRTTLGRGRALIDAFTDEGDIILKTY